MSIKNIARQIARNIFGRSIEVVDLPIKFHKDANYYGTHGKLQGNSVEHNLKDAEIRFVFPGMSTPPALTPRIMEYIWEEARAAGFVPTKLINYGQVIPTERELEARAAVSAARIAAERAGKPATAGAMDPKVNNVAALNRS